MAKKTVSVAVSDPKIIEQMVAEYNELKIKEKHIKDRKAVLSDAIKTYSLTNGTKDDKGSYYLDTDKYSFGAMCKKSVKFNTDKAVEFFQSRGFDDCITFSPQIVESAVEKHLDNGDITVGDLEDITNTSVSYAVSVKAKEEVVEVQQTTFAAKKKPTLKRK